MLQIDTHCETVILRVNDNMLYIWTNFQSDLTYDLPASTITLVIGSFTVENKEVDAFSQLEVIVEAEVNEEG